MCLLSVKKIFKTILLVVIILLTFSSVVHGATRTWTGGTGAGKSWNTAANWGGTVPVTGDDVVFNTAGTITFSTMPTGSRLFNSLIISQGTVTLAGTIRTFTLGGNAGVDFIVANGATLVTTNLNITLAASATATIDGTLTVSTGRIFNTDGTSVVTTVNGTINRIGTVTCTAATKLLFQSGSTYIHALNGGAIPTATWNVASNCNITGVTTTVPTVATLNQSFGNFTWNCPSQSADILLTANLKTINGNFTVTSTSTRQLILSTGTATTLTVGGNFTMTAGTLNFNSGANVSAMNLLGNFSQTGGTITESGTGTGTISFNKTGTQTYSKTGGTISNTINFNVASSSVLDVGTSVVNGSIGTFTLNSGAGIITAHPQGLSTTAATGSVQVTGIKTYSIGANYTYNGTTGQDTGNGLTSANNLTINNVAGVTLSSATTIVSGSLSLINGKLITGTNTLSVTNSASGAISTYSSSSYVNGRLQRAMTSGSSYFFPIGDASNYRPFEMNGIVGSSPVVRVSMANTGASTYDGTLVSIAARNWYAELIGGTISSATIRITESGLNSNSVVASSTSQSGIYTTKGGNNIGLTITSNPSISYTGSTYFAIGSAYPVVVLSNNGTQIAAGNIAGAISNVVLHKSSLAVTVVDAMLSGMTCTTGGSYVSSDITNLKVWYQTSGTFNAGTATLLSTLATPGTAGTKTFPSFTQQSINSATTGYIFITADIPCASTYGSTINVNALTTSNLTFLSGSISGSTTNGGTQTLQITPENVTAYSASVAYASSTLNWANPTGCYDEIMVVAKAASSVIGTPSGNGSTYTANLTFGSGTAFGGGFVVYKGAVSPQTVINLTNGTIYYFKFFTRNGTRWSAGVEAIATPQTTSVTDYFRSKASGDWNIVSTWESSKDGIFWEDASILPTSTAYYILIQNGHTVFATTSPIYANLTVSGTYEHRLDGGTIPSATWNTGSTCLITGITNATPTGFNQTFGNFTWNCASQSGNTITTDGDIVVNGNFTLAAGTFALSASTTVNRTMTISGNYIQTAGVFDSNRVGDGSLSTVFLAGNMLNTTAAESITTVGAGAVNGQFIFNGSSFQTIYLANSNAPIWTTFIINAGSSVKLNSNITLTGDKQEPKYYADFIVNGTLDLGTYIINDLGYQGVIDASHFILNSGASLITANTGGISLTGNSGSIQFNGPRTYNAGANYTYDGTSAQVTGNALTGANNLTINNVAGVTLTNNVSVSGFLELSSGILTTATNSITVTNTSSNAITGGSSSSYVNGKLAWNFSTTGSKTFPLGKGGNYRPLTINFSALTGTSTVTAEQIEASLPGTLPAKTTLFGDRYWQISQSGGSNFSFFLTLDGTGWSRVGTPKMLKGNGTANFAFDVSGSIYVNTTAFSNFENFGLGETDIYWNGSINENWFTPENWSSVLVPNGTIDITIPSSLSRYPVLSGNSPANDVTIKNAVSLILEDGATMSLEAGPVLTIESGATVAIGTGSKIILKSDAAYINLSNSTPTLEMERTLTGVKGWRMVASPLNTKINDMLTSPLITQGFTGSTYPLLQPNLMWWDETDPGTSLQSWRKPANMTDDVTGGRGLFHYIFNGAGIAGGGTYADALPQTMSVTGVENYNGSGSYNYNLSYTARTPLTSGTNYDDINALDQGWNLIGNPTASTLDWDATTAWTKTNVDNTIYVWDPSALSGNGDYLYWNGSTGTLPNGKIPPFQAFWVHANTTSPVLSFTNAAKTSTTGTFMRSPAVNESLNVPITLTSNGMETTSFISFTNNGIKGPDNKDAYRLEPMNDAWIELYTLSSPDHVSPLTINNLPVDDSDLVNIPLFVGVQQADSTINDAFTLKWNLPDNWPSDWNISLQHHQVSTAVSMTDNVEYTFNYAANQAVNSSASGGMYAPKQLVKHGAKKDPTVKKLPDFSIIISKNGKEIGYMEPVPRFMLNYPNPFSNNTTLRFSLPKSEQVRMEVYNLNGLRIETLTNRIFPAGISEIQWYPNSKIPGVYFIRFISGDTVETRKVIYEH